MSSTSPTLYRIHDAAGNLLYVGSSQVVLKRLQQHALQRGWWHEVASIEIEHFATPEALIEAERVAISEERPLHNTQNNPVVSMAALKRQRRAALKAA
jgi:predicted GIY-YIG superfamily endonuclease